MATLLRVAWSLASPRTPFTRNVLTLVGASALANGVSVLASPVITRLYSPEEFGLFGSFSSIVAVLTVIASLRVEITVPLPEKHSDALNLLVLGATVLVLITGAMGIGLLVIPVDRLGWTESAELTPYLWLVPIIVAWAAMGQLARFWNLRYKHFRPNAVASLSRNSSQVTVQIALGLLGFGVSGLLIGIFVSQLVASFVLIFGAIRTFWPLRREVAWPAMQRVMHEYTPLCMFSTASTLCSTLAVWSPFLLLSVYYDHAVAGAFLLCQRILGMPMRLIGRSICDVFFAESAKLIHGETDRLIRIYRKTTARLAIIGSMIFAVGIAAPLYFTTLFGARWAEAAGYCQMLSLVVACQFVASSTSNLTTYRRERWQLGWNLLNLVTTVGTIMGSGWLGWSVNRMVLSFSLAGSLNYVLLLWLNYTAIQRLHREREFSC